MAYLKNKHDKADRTVVDSATDVGLSNVENTALSTWAGTSNITTLGTITTGALNNTIHGKYTLAEVGNAHFGSSTNSTTAGIENTSLNIMGTNYTTLATGSSTADRLIIHMYPGAMHRSAGYNGFGLCRATNTGFTISNSMMWATGEHHEGTGLADNYGDPYYGQGVSLIATVSDWGLSASTTYYMRMIGQVHNTGGNFYWGQLQGGHIGGGVRLSHELWRAV